MTPDSSISPWDRLQEILVALTPGQTITVEGVAADTGLSPDTTRMILDGLAKAGLFERRDDVFVRRSLFRPVMNCADPLAIS